MTDHIAAVLPDVPFLCHFRQGARIAFEGPYQELVMYLRWHSRHKVQPTFATLDYFDGVHFAQRATAPALFSVALMDPICPPSTVYAAFNHYAGVDRTITVWPFADQKRVAGAVGDADNLHAHGRVEIPEDALVRQVVRVQAGAAGVAVHRILPIVIGCGQPAVGRTHVDRYLRRTAREFMDGQ